jgi:hypothetical protein
MQSSQAPYGKGRYRSASKVGKALAATKPCLCGIARIASFLGVIAILGNKREKERDFFIGM